MLGLEGSVICSLEIGENGIVQLVAFTYDLMCPLLPFRSMPSFPFIFAGTPHYQGQVQFKRAYRFSQLKKLQPHAHWEATIQHSDRNYYRKHGSIIIRDDPVSGPGARLDLVAGQRHFKEGGTMVEFREQYPALAARYHAYFEQYARDQERPQLQQLDPKNLFDWQEYLLYDVLCKPAHDRRIYVILDTVGGQGKTTFANWIASTYPNTQIFGSGKSSDLACAVLPTTTTFLFDFTRSSDVSPPWGIIESIKDQRVWSPKYVSITKFVLKRPHCIIFTNTPVPPGVYSDDRVELHDISPLADYPIFYPPSATAPNFVVPPQSAAAVGSVAPPARIPIPSSSDVQRILGRPPRARSHSPEF